MQEKVIIMGAAGRDFHNFNVYFRNNPRYRVMAFTANQIDGIEGRRYPSELCGEGYPEGIPIHHESDLTYVISHYKVDLVVFSYSDVPHSYVMHKAAKVQSMGADFLLIGAQYTMIESTKPVISVCAVRTGCGKSQTSRKVLQILRDQGKQAVVVRHPMPYGDLSRQKVQRFASYDDMDRHQCTIEEREEYEPIIDLGGVVYAGIDYEAILRDAGQEADVVIWDGGNNDTPFFKPDVAITVFDPHRPGHERLYHPGETNMLLADIAVINKMDTADSDNVDVVQTNIKRFNPKAQIIYAESPVVVDQPELVRDKRVLVVEDGPTVTHGEMPFGAGTVAAKEYGAAELVDPRSCARGLIRDVYRKYPHLGPVLPAMGYSEEQVGDLKASIEACDCDAVLLATPANISRIMELDVPMVRANYSYADAGDPSLERHLCQLLDLRIPHWR
jgi:predicted GTPase